MNSLADRFKEAMQGPPKVTGAALAKACGCSAASVSGWLSGKTLTIKAVYLLAAAKFLDVDPDWLERGIGFKQRRTVWRVEEPLAQYLTDDPLLVEAAALVRQVPKEKIPEAVNFLKFLLASNGKTTS